MSLDTEDQSRRDLGGRARLALDALEVAIWNRSVRILQQAEILQQNDELTLERSHTLMISLLEQRKIFSDLQSQVSAGVKAVLRINKRIDGKAAEKAEEERIRTHGRNRFTRSKVGKAIP